MISNRELRSLGILPPKRKQPARLSDRAKKARMDVPNIFDEFNSTIYKVLRGYQDHDTILHTLRCLAEGKESLIGHLPGIGNQPCATTPDGKYAQVMSVLLSWAIRTFPVQPSETLDHLWMTMAIIDGPKGYNQRLAEQLTPRSRTLTN